MCLANRPALVCGKIRPVRGIGMALPRVLVAYARAVKPRGTVSEWLTKVLGKQQGVVGTGGRGRDWRAWHRYGLSLHTAPGYSVVRYKCHRQVGRAFKGEWDSNSDRFPRLILLTGFLNHCPYIAPVPDFWMLIS